PATAADPSLGDLHFQPGGYADRANPAIIMGDSGVTISYAELDARSKQFAQLLAAGGLRRGDHIAILLDNHPRYLELYWGAQRAGLYTTPINWHLNPDEVHYILEDCGAQALVTGVALEGLAAQLEPACPIRLMTDGTI